MFCSDRSAAYHNKRQMFGTDELLNLYRCGLGTTFTGVDRPQPLFPSSLQGFDAIRPCNGWSRVRVPGNITFICLLFALSIFVFLFMIYLGILIHKTCD